MVNGLIDDSGPASELRALYPGDDLCDGAGCVVLPGFVNAHVHLYGVLAHGVPAPAQPPADFWGFLDDYWWPLVENALDHEMIAAAASWVTADLAASGTTSFFDILEAPNALPGALSAQRDAVAPQRAAGGAVLRGHRADGSGQRPVRTRREHRLHRGVPGRRRLVG